MIQVVRGWHEASYRNIAIPKDDDLIKMMRDAYRLSDNVFKLLYGSKVFRYRAPDNSIRVYTHWRDVPCTPILKRRSSEHKTPPRKGDVIAFISSDDDAPTYGRIIWISRDDDAVGVLVFNVNDMKTLELSSLESTTAMGPRVRWRIYE